MGTTHDRWLSRRGEAIDAFKKSYGGSALTSQDRLIALVWLMARSMRSNGDLSAARGTDPTYLAEAQAMAARLELPVAVAAFSGSEGGLERRFFDVFDGLCRELQTL